MSQKCYIGLDQGSTGTKVSLVSTEGEILFEDYLAVQTTWVNEDCVEQDPEALFSSLEELGNRAHIFALKEKLQVRRIGIALQRSGVCSWDRETGEIRAPLWSWRDQRERPRVNALEQYREMIMKNTGLPLDPGYAAPKIAAQQALFIDDRVLTGTLDSYVSYRLGGGFVTDDTMAARTLLYDLHVQAFGERLVDIFDVKLKRLPKIEPSIGGNFGALAGVPVTASLGDQQSALLAAGMDDGLPLLNLGTIASFCCATGDAPNILDGYSSSVLYSKKREERREYRFLLESTTRCCGKTFDEIVRLLGKSNLTPIEIDVHCEEILPEHESLPVLYTTLGNAGSPFWETLQEGVASETPPEGSRERAFLLLENLGFLIADNIIALRNAEVFSGSEVMISGGYSLSSALLGCIGAVTDLKVSRSDNRNLTVAGAARAAMMSDGVEWQPEIEATSIEDGFFQDRVLGNRFGVWKTLQKAAHARESANFVKVSW